MTAPDARPERVWVDDTGTDWGWYPEDPMIRGYSSYVPESRLREVEAARDDALEKLAYTKKDIDVLIEKCAALRAERDALVPLARYALNWCADDPAPSPEQRAAARAILAAREGA